MYLEPKAVNPQPLKRWLRDAIDLIKRRWEWFVLLGSVYYGCVVLTFDIIGLVVITFLPLLVACGVIISLAADKQTGVINEFLTIKKHVWLRTVFIPGVFAVTWIVVNTLMSMMAIFERLTNPPSDPGLVTKLMALIAIGIISYFLRHHSFCWALCVLMGVPLNIAHDQSVKAVGLNKYIWKPFVISSIAFILILVIFSPLLIVWMPVVSALSYVAYRDVWLGQRKNLPDTQNLTEDSSNSAVT